MVAFMRAEREADWLLHLWAVEQMIPYFFAASHFNCERYGLYYLKTMEHLPSELLQRFMKGEHSMRQRPRLRNYLVCYLDRDDLYALWSWSKWNNRHNPKV